MTELPPPPNHQYLSYETPLSRPKGLAIASMVCGICSIPGMACVWFLAIPAAIVAIVLGFVARSKANRGEAEGRGMALAGIICGSSALALAVVVIAIFAIFISTAAKTAKWKTATTTTVVTMTPKGVRTVNVSPPPSPIPSPPPASPTAPK